MTTVVSLNVVIYIGFVSTLLYIAYSSIFVKEIAPVEINLKKSQEEWKIVATTISSQLFRTTPGSFRNYINKSKVPQAVKTFGGLSTWLCLKERNRPKNSLKPQLKVHPCPADGKGIVTVHPGGRTGGFYWFV